MRAPSPRSPVLASMPRRSALVLLAVALPHVLAGGRAAEAWRAGAPAAAAATSRAGQAAAGFEARWAELVRFYRDGLSQHGIIGSSLLLMHRGQVAGRAMEGLMDLEGRRPVDEDTIFHWASITKSVTGIAIMQLRDRGLLALDDPAIKYLPELRAVHNPYGDMSQVTIRHLMTHSSGLRGGTWPWGGGEPWHPFEPQRWDQLVAMFPYTNILFPPGSRFSYSNPGVVLLGRIIEELTLDDYEVYVDKNVFKPLQMHRAYFDTAPHHLRPHLSHSWYRVDGKLEPARFDANTGLTVSNGGLNAPLGDMGRYLAFLMGDPARQAEYDGVLRRRSLEEMFQPQVKIDEPREPQWRATGLSFFVEEVAGLPLIGHWGEQNGFIAQLYLHVPSRTGYLVNFNTHAYGDRQPAAQDTDRFEAALRDEIVAKLFPLLAR